MKKKIRLNSKVVIRTKLEQNGLRIKNNQWGQILLGSYKKMWTIQKVFTTEQNSQVPDSLSTQVK